MSFGQCKLRNVQGCCEKSAVQCHQSRGLPALKWTPECIPMVMKEGTQI